MKPLRRTVPDDCRKAADDDPGRVAEVESRAVEMVWGKDSMSTASRAILIPGGKNE